MSADADQPQKISIARQLGKGWFGSIRKRVEADIREHTATNVRLKRTRYSIALRQIQAVFGNRSIFGFLTAYALIDIIFVTAEGFTLNVWPEVGGFWSGDSMKGFLKDSIGFLISAQASLVGVAAVAIALITFVAQKSNKASDVELYYAESLSYEVTKSGVALLVILVIQIYWPLQFGLHLLGYGSQSLVFKVALTGIHATWLAMNLVIFGHFMVSSLQFVQFRERSRMRKLWTTRVILRPMLTSNLMRYYGSVAADRLKVKRSDSEEHLLFIGHRPMSQGSEPEVRRTFTKQSLLHDIRLAPLERAIFAARQSR